MGVESVELGGNLGGEFRNVFAVAGMSHPLQHFFVGVEDGAVLSVVCCDAVEPSLRRATQR
ncbi:hypothetical protein [Gordonia sp. CPCC 205333]|uniref:hypothetical protein n=1 Tax=Gordonia sp. CPCC 205333 TaxID=3140790 RepID=UPI003AF39BC3